VRIPDSTRGNTDIPHLTFVSGLPLAEVE